MQLLQSMIQMAMPAWLFRDKVDEMSVNISKKKKKKNNKQLNEVNSDD